MVSLCTDTIPNGAILARYYHGLSGGPPFGPAGALGQKNQMMITHLGTFRQSECWHSKGQPAIATIFYISFVIIASFIVLSLFIGAVCGGMAEALDEFEAEDERAKAEAKIQMENTENPNAAFISVLVH
jgi:hypothetical protein